MGTLRLSQPDHSFLPRSETGQRCDRDFCGSFLAISLQKFPHSLAQGQPVASSWGALAHHAPKIELNHGFSKDDPASGVRIPPTFVSSAAVMSRGPPPTLWLAEPFATVSTPTHWRGSRPLIFAFEC
jgi:hypothetical protein